jgi:hypothetical protein
MLSHSNKTLSIIKSEEILETLKTRFEGNFNRHKNIEWTNVQANLAAMPEKLWSIYQMEITGGEPDVLGFNESTKQYIFYDCSLESPQGRRSICYDNQALERRKENKPKDSAVNMATNMGIEILTETQYKELQKLGNFDLKTSSWVQTPTNIRKLGGAIFCDCRYNAVFTYHNGAESYYAARGFRGWLSV